MTIYIDSVLTHGSSGTGDDTVPPGVAGLDWCHMVSDSSMVELMTFLTVNVLTIGAISAFIRTPALGALQTYIGLNVTQRTAAITAGATPARNSGMTQKSFDSPHSSSPPYWEP